MKEPTQRDYKKLVKLIYNSGQVNTFDLIDMGYEEEDDLEKFIHYRLDILVDWLEEFVKFEQVWGYRIPGYRRYAIYIHLRTELLDFDIGTSHRSDSGIIDYTLWLRVEESVESVVNTSLVDPEFDRKKPKENCEKGMWFYSNNQFGYEELARKLIEIYRR